MKLRLLLSLTTFACAFSVHANVQVQVRAYTRVFSETQVKLADVVERSELSPDIEKKLATVTLGDAPRLGEQRVYTNVAIADAVRRSLGKSDWSFKIPHKVIVENKGFQIDRETIETELLARWQKLCGDCQIRFVNLQLPALPAWAAQAPWSLPAEETHRLPRGHFAQRLSIAGVDGRSQIFWVNGSIEVKRKVPVLNRSTPMGTRFTAEDFTLVWRDVTQATDNSPVAQEIVGQQAKYTMNANDIIWRGSLVREKAVKRGELVKVLTGETGWEISLQAITEQDGFVGDNVNLRNIQTNKLITGRVSAPGEVEIR